MNIEKVKLALLDAADAQYRDFSKGLNPAAGQARLGVRLPVLREMAAALAKEDARDFLDCCDFSSIEMTILYAFVLGRLKSDIQEALVYFDRAVSRIENWETNDSLCQSFKQAAKYRAETWDLLMRYRESPRPFTLRVLAVTLMSHFLTDDYIDGVLEVLDGISCGDYYCRMGVAWAVATAMAKYRDKTMKFLTVTRLDDWTYNKAIQKTLESYRVTPEDKALLRTMKRAVKNEE